MVGVSLKPASIMCTLASELGDMTSCTKSGFDSKPKPSGTEIDTAGRASSVLDITAVARLRREIDRELIAEGVREQKCKNQQNKHCFRRENSKWLTYTGVNGSWPSLAIFSK